jgi:hypothetical protein
MSISVPPPAELTAAGLCHHLSITGTPGALEVTLNNGVPVSHLIIGYLETGQPVAIDSPSLEWLGKLAYAIQLDQARLSMWIQNRVHPFGDEAGAA